MKEKLTMSNNLKNPLEEQLNKTVSYGYRVKSKNKPLQLVPFSTIVESIKTGTHGLKENIEKIRACQNDEQRRELKKQLLPFFSMAIYRDGERKNVNLQSINHIILDVDHLGDQNALIKMKKKLTTDETVFCCFNSPSGDGLKVVYQLDREITDDNEYKKIYKHSATTISKLYGFQTDNTHDSARACFLSYDPEIYVNYKCVVLSTTLRIELPEDIIPNDKKNEILQNLSGTSKGSRTTSATQLVGMYINKGFDKEFTTEHLRLWNTQNTPPLSEPDITYIVNDMYNRYEEKTISLPVQFVNNNNSYYKKSNNSIVTTFTINPKELLVLDDSDCLKCDVTSAHGYTYTDIHIENTDWHSKTKLLKAIGHQDCTFHGSENDVQALCSYVNGNVPVRKQGTKVIGLIGNTWVTKDFNITSSGILQAPIIIPFDKGADAFYHGISYSQLSESDYQDMITTFYENIVNINEHVVILPWLAWTLATPFKPLIMKSLTAYPLVFVHGGQGSGKTTTGKMFKRLCGYTVADPTSCTQRSFPTLKQLSSTNAIPVVLDEFKVSDMKEDEVSTLIRYMRRTYAGEVESKGRPDQTVGNYLLQAPLTVMGEWNIDQPAIKERVLIIRFSDKVKKNISMQDAFAKVWNLSLEGFMPRYIEFCLKQNYESLLNQAILTVKNHFKDIPIAARIINNLSVMVLGIELFKKYGSHRNITVPEIDTGLLLNEQLKEITGSANGFVKSAVDQLIEELSVMAQNSLITENQDFKIAHIDEANNKSRKILAIRFKKIFPKFKEHAKRTSYEGELIDGESYRRQFNDCEYIFDKSYGVKFGDKTHRCLCIDVEKIKRTNLDLDGFEI